MEKEKLHNIKSTGFKTPDHYFKYLENDILARIKLNEKAQDSGLKTPKSYFNNLEYSVFSEVKINVNANETGFKTPKNYFNTLDKTILKNVHSKKEAKVIPLFNKKTILYTATLAAALILFFNSTFFNTPITFDSLGTELVDNYILNETESNDLVVLFTDTELNEASFIDYDFSDDSLETYLEENELILK